MNTRGKITLVVVVILVVLLSMSVGTAPEEVNTLKREYSLFEIGFGLLFLSSFIWVPLLLVLFAPSMTR